MRKAQWSEPGLKVKPNLVVFLTALDLVGEDLAPLYLPSPVSL